MDLLRTCILRRLRKEKLRALATVPGVALGIAVKNQGSNSGSDTAAARLRTIRLFPCPPFGFQTDTIFFGPAIIILLLKITFF